MLTRASSSCVTLQGNELLKSSIRAVSSKYPRPTPRHPKRRLFEAAVTPVLPPQLKTCIPPGLLYKHKTEEALKYSDVELALSSLVKRWMTNQEFRVMAICQFLPVQGRTLYLAKNQLRLKGLEFRNYGNRIMKKVFEGTPMSSLDVALVGSNAVLFGKDVADMKTVITETEKLNWLIPLVVMVDDRVVSMPEARRLAALRSLDDVRVETVQLLTSQIAQLPMTLDSQGRQLTQSLDHIAQTKSQTQSSE